jgi:transcriptional regulator with XRE-family HTH domain
MKIYCNENLRKTRRNKDFSQEYIALKLGISQKSYSDMELGKVKLKDDIILRLSSLLEVSITELCALSCHCINDNETKLKKILSYLHEKNIIIPNSLLE